MGKSIKYFFNYLAQAYQEWKIAIKNNVDKWEEFRKVTAKNEEKKYKEIKFNTPYDKPFNWEDYEWRK